MWDGIENAGWGVHDSSANIWPSLVGKRYWNLSSTANFTSNSFSCKGGIGATGSESVFDFVQCEIVFKTRSWDSSSEEAQRTIFMSHMTSPSDFDANQLLLANNGLNDIHIGYNSVLKGEYLGNGILHCVSWKYGEIANNVYINGLPKDDVKKGNLYNASRGPFLGGRNDASNGRWWDGEIFSIRMYDAELAANDVAMNWEIDKARFGLEVQS